ncbi:MAG TPA: hypothetical protein VNJ51_01640 [Candidatus Dormibacteraeota bacterium]|nr:hypothetical protein [Candidatus Dormibacteraeota bacterium]
MQRRIAVGALICVFGASGAAQGAAAPTPMPAVSPTPAAPAAIAPKPGRTPAPKDVLPLNTALVLELDDEVNTATAKQGQTFRAHLKDPIMLDGLTVAPAGTPVIGQVVFDSRASAPDHDGYMSVTFGPLKLAGGQSLPLRPFSSTWDIHVTAGEESTAEVTDVVKDIFIPYHYLYRQFRKGSDLDLKPGTTVHAVTMGTVRMIAGNPQVEVLQPVRLGTAVPFTTVTPIPLFTPQPLIKATPKPGPSPSAAPSPSPSADAAPSSTP